MSGFHYLATPYSRYPGGIEAAYVLACEATAFLLKNKIAAFSPIAHTHGVAIHGQIDPLSHDIWLPADEPFMEAAKGLIVLRACGWGTSHGIAEEIKAFRWMNKPVRYMDPGHLPGLPVPASPRELSEHERQAQLQIW